MPVDLPDTPESTPSNEHSAVFPQAEQGLRRIRIWYWIATVAVLLCCAGSVVLALVASTRAGHAAHESHLTGLSNHQLLLELQADTAAINRSLERAGGKLDVTLRAVQVEQQRIEAILAYNGVKLPPGLVPVPSPSPTR